MMSGQPKVFQEKPGLGWFRGDLGPQLAFAQIASCGCGAVAIRPALAIYRRCALECCSILESKGERVGWHSSLGHGRKSCNATAPN